MAKELFVKGEPCKCCGCKIRMLKYVKPHVGAYCARCTIWIKWLSKKEKAEYNIITPNDVKKEPDGKTIQIQNIDEFDRPLNAEIDEELPWYD